MRGCFHGRCGGRSLRAWAARPPARRRGAAAAPAVSGALPVAAGMSSSSVMASSASLSAQVEPRRLQLRVAVDRVEALVAAEAGLLVAPERHGDVGRIEGVDPDDAGPDCPRQAMRAVDVARPDSGG